MSQVENTVNELIKQHKAETEALKFLVDNVKVLMFDLEWYNERNNYQHKEVVEATKLTEKILHNLTQVLTKKRIYLTKELQIKE